MLGVVSPLGGWIPLYSSARDAGIGTGKQFSRDRPVTGL